MMLLNARLSRQNGLFPLLSGNPVLIAQTHAASNSINATHTPSEFLNSMLSQFVLLVQINITANLDVASNFTVKAR